MSATGKSSLFAKTEELKEKLKKWREEKIAHGKGPLKRPFGQVNKPAVVSVATKNPSKDSTITKPAKIVSKTSTVKPTAVVKPQTRAHSTTNQENLGVKKPADQAVKNQQSSEELRQKLEEWKKKKNEGKPPHTEQNRRLTFIPSSAKVALPSVSNQHVPLLKKGAKIPEKIPVQTKPAFNRRQTISTTTLTERSRKSIATKPVTGRIAIQPTSGQFISNPTKQAFKPATSTSTAVPFRKETQQPSKKLPISNPEKDASNRRVSLATIRRKSPRASAVVSKPTNRIFGGRLSMPASKPSSVQPPRPRGATASATASQPSLSANRQPVISTNPERKPAAVSGRLSIQPLKQSKLAKRQSPRNHAGVKRLSIPSRAGAPSFVSSATLKRRAASTSTLPKPDVIRQGAYALKRSASVVQLVKKLPPRKSILKTPHKCTSPIAEETSLDETPPIEVKGTGVRFTVPVGTPSTGSKRKSVTSIGLTPEEARREKLNAWLIAKGKTPTRYRHLCCFDEQVSAKKKKVACTKSGLSADELAKQQSQLEQEGSGVSAATSKAEDADKEEQEQEVLVNTEGLEELKTMLDECSSLYDAGCPPGSVLGWLDDIAAHYPRSTSSAAYWICRARIVEDDSDDHVTVDIFEQACRHNAQPAEEVAEALRQFIIRMEDRARSRKMASHTPRRTQEVQEENAFQSSAIKYCLTHTTPFFKKLHRRADQEDTPLSVITPVRRSTRRSLATLPDMLRDHDVIMETLEDVPQEERAATLYLPNDAISTIEAEEEVMEVDEDEEEELFQLALMPLQRSLTAEFMAAEDDN